MEELKPCPFCGGKDINIFESYFDVLPVMSIECENCGIDIDFGCSKFKTKKAVRNNAIKLWNKRV